MSYSSTITKTTSFTVTHAKHISAKVVTDLKRMQRFYGSPSDEKIVEYAVELIILLKHGCLGTVTYGFLRDGKYIEPTIKYTAQDLEGASANDNDPGRIYPGADISGAAFYSYLTCSSAWYSLTSQQKEELERQIPVKRSGGTEPTVNGYFLNDKTYSAGGRALNRASVRNF